MRAARFAAMLWVAIGLAGLAAPATAQTLAVIGASAKVCQLTGQKDWFTGQPTNARTKSRYGLFGVDLGFPVEAANGKLLFLFGDTRPSGHSVGDTTTPDDAIGITKRTKAPDAATCLDMKMLTRPKGNLGHPTVQPAIAQGSFNVPSGGITIGGQIYAFFWTNHCLVVDAYGENPTTPLALPSPLGPPLPQGACPETASQNSLGASVLAAATPPDKLDYQQVAVWTPVAYVPQMPNGFVYVTAATPAPPSPYVQLPPWLGKPAIPVFGVARFRASIPYLAMAPQASFGQFDTWTFYGGVGANGSPTWLTYQQWQSGQNGGQWSPPAGAELYANGPNAYTFTGDERCVGEHSVNWVPKLGVWLMLYACGEKQIEARTAPDPWGPWSGPTVILSTIENPGLYCTLLWTPAYLPGCPGLHSQWKPRLSSGHFYAPFLLSRYTQVATPKGSESNNAATIYWLLSTFDPYQVTVMQTTLQLTE